MTHREISGLLADLAQGRLGYSVQAEVQRHLAECPTCRAWLETYELLGVALSEQEEFQHLDPAELADGAVLDGELPAEATAHLAACAACRGELELVEAALASARHLVPVEEREVQPAPERQRNAAIAWSTIAATLIAVLAGSVLLAPRGGPEGERIVTGGELTGAATISARSIFALDVEIPPGSNIVFEASETLTLGDGFAVASGASFSAMATASTRD